EADPAGDGYRAKLAAHDAASGELLAELTRDSIPAERLAGNLALFANVSPGGPAGTPKKAPAPKKKAPAAPAGGRFWFADWRVSGSKVENHSDRVFGPILFSQYTVSRGVLKLTAQMPPLGENDSSTVE